MRTLRRRKRGKVLPKGVARPSWGTFRGCNVARGYRPELLGNVLGAVMSPESVAQPCCGNDVGVKCVQGCRRCLWAYSRRDQCGRYGDGKEAKCRPRVSRGLVVERCGLETSPEDIAWPCWGTLCGCNVARECRMALLWNDIGLKRLPRVLKVSPGLFKTASMRTLQRRKSGKVLPKGAAQPCWGTFRGCNVARECRMTLLWNDIGL